MHGWRGRIGLILPMDNAVMEPELYSLGLEGIAFYGARLTTRERQAMPEEGIRLSASFRELGVDAVVYACAETSFLKGIDGNQAIAEAIQDAAGCPAVTATGAMVEALRHLKALRIGLLTPYRKTSGEVMESFLRRQGFEVVEARHRDFSLEHPDPREWYGCNVQPPATAYRMAMQMDAMQLDALLISATNFRTLEIIANLEQDLGIPVVTSNQAILWWALRRIGIAIKRSKLGLLLGRNKEEST